MEKDEKTEEIARISKAISPVAVSEKPETAQDDPLEDSGKLDALLYLEGLLTWWTD